MELSGDNAVTENDVVNTDKWAATIDLPAKTLTGSPINYTIAEQGAVTNNGVTTLPIDGSDKAYKVKYDQDSLTVTNSYEPETISINVEKYWKDSDNQDGKRPESITVRVMNGEDEAATAIVKPDENGSWKHQFADLPKYANSQLICYTIAEDKVNNYSTETIAQPDMDEETNTYTVAITNTYTPETVTVEVNKIWDDKNNQDGKRPNAVTFQLYKQVGDEETAVKVDGRILTLSATDGNWTTEDLKGTFGSLPKCENGQEITYSVVENKVDGYTSVVGAIADGEITVTNTHTPETITISGEKIWVGDSNIARPDSITVKVMNGEEVANEATVTSDGNWKYEFTNLPKYSNGSLIDYTVVEANVPTGYVATVGELQVGEAENTYSVNITNKVAETQYQIEYYYQQLDGTYALKASKEREATFSQRVSVTDADMEPDTAFTDGCIYKVNMDHPESNLSDVVVMATEENG